jgi:hypothetical protein
VAEVDGTDPVGQLEVGDGEVDRRDADAQPVPCDGDVPQGDRSRLGGVWGRSQHCSGPRIRVFTAVSAGALLSLVAQTREEGAHPEVRRAGPAVARGLGGMLMHPLDRSEVLSEAFEMPPSGGPAWIVGLWRYACRRHGKPRFSWV